MSKKEIAKYILHIETLKAGLSRVRRFISEHENEPMSDSLRNQLETRKDALKNNFDKFQEVQFQLLYLDPQQDDNSDDFEQEYFDILTTINLRLRSSHKSQNSATSPTILSNNISTAKLPHIDIPTFDGKNLNDFKPFIEIFMAVIDNNSSLSDVEKLFYLRNYLKGEALTLVNTLPILNSSYDEALNILKNRYDNEIMLINSHITSILEIPNIQKGSPAALREFISKIKQQIGALKNLKQPVNHWDMILICILSKKLDQYTNRSYQIDRDTSKLPTIDGFLQYLENRAMALETAGNSEKRFPEKPKFSHLTLQHDKLKDTKCLFCKITGHKIYNCKKFKTISVSDRISFIDKNKFCRVCLNSHLGKCKLSIKCQTCAKDHNSLLHLEKSEWYQSNVVTNDKEITFNGFQETAHNVLLPTVKVQVKGKNGNFVDAYCLLDSGSQMSLISNEFVKKLELSPFKNKINVMGISENVTRVQSSVYIDIKSCLYSYKTTVKCAVVDKISKIPQFELSSLNEVEFPKFIQLSDSEYNKPKNIDILLSADIFFQILLKDRHKLENGLVLQNTLFGYIVSGSVPLNSITSDHSPVAFHAICNNIEQLISQFWETEKVPEIYPEYTSEQEACETIFNNSIQKIDNKFQVDLPLKLPMQDLNLGDSFSVAYKRFQNLEKRFKANPEVFRQYKLFIDEYISLNHAKVIDINSYDLDNGQVYFMAHQPVIREDKRTTSFRVVFDGSMKSKNKTSINDFLYNGAVVQSALFEILTLFRTYKFVILTDIKKMYRIILINPEHCPLQNILWRENPSMPIQCLQLQTVTYGLKSSSFLATRCLVHLANSESQEFPLAANALLKNTYVDDILTGANTLQDALKLKNELINLLKLGSFELHKWCTNNPSILNDIPKDKCHLTEVDMNKADSVIKTLGLSYIPNTDSFKITSPKTEIDSCITKRQVLGFISKFYDPLGLVGPILVKAKLFMQKLWMLKLGWDEIIPNDLLESWKQFVKDLMSMPPINIPRNLNFVDAEKITLIGFCDASTMAYGAVLYTRVIKNTGIFVSLICSKSRIVPLNKNLTIPRLELNSALLLANLASTTYNILQSKINDVILFSDSNITLAWIKSNPLKLNPYVANRVTKIQKANSSFQWQYINTKENPADYLSRGLEPMQIYKNVSWFQGPIIISDKFFLDNNFPITIPEPLPETKEMVALNITKPEESFFNKFSDILTLQRIVAYMFRFVHNARNKNKINENLKGSELDFALKIIIRHEQNYAFSSEIQSLKNNLPIKSNLSSLSPFLDSDKILRVGGRLQNANINFNQKHPIILPKNNYITDLMIRKEHFNLLHAGQKQVLSSLNLNYWIINGNREVKKIIHKCVICFKAKAQCSQQLMGSLPESRVSQNRPFQNVGIDFCGPFYIKQSRLRKAVVTKAYIALFVCFAVKAIHMELLSDLTTETFLAAFKRFISRRGKPSQVFCDNGATFIGAKNKLNEYYVMFQTKDSLNKINNFYLENKIEFKFIPSYSPVFGGLWEAGVKSAKYHIKRVAGNSQLSYEELNTLIIQIEGILNSRPITPISNDPSDLSYLTPGHFLIGAPITSYPEPDYTNIPENRLKFWKLCSQMQQHFWQRWHKDYLAQLQSRPKWRYDIPNVQENMLVLLKDDNVPSLKWPMARIVKVIPGKDGKVRVVQVKTKNGIYLRSISKIAILPIDN